MFSIGFGRARNDQRSTRFINKDRINLIDNRKAEIALHHIFKTEFQIVTKVVKAELIIRAVSYITTIGGTALIIIKPGFAEINLGTIAILVTAPLFAASDLIAKRLKAFDDDKMIIFSLSVGIAAFMMIPAIGVWQPITPTNWIGIMAISIAATLGHITLMRSFSGPMWAAQTGKYMQLLFVVLFGIALFDEIPALSTLLGALVVLAAVSYIAVREGRSRAAGP